MSTIEALKYLGACKSAISWAEKNEYNSFQELWNNCQVPEWMVWLSSKLLETQGTLGECRVLQLLYSLLFQFPERNFHKFHKHLGKPLYLLTESPSGALRNYVVETTNISLYHLYNYYDSLNHITLNLTNLDVVNMARKWHVKAISHYLIMKLQLLDGNFKPDLSIAIVRNLMNSTQLYDFSNFNHNLPLSQFISNENVKHYSMSNFIRKTITLDY